MCCGGNGHRDTACWLASPWWDNLWLGFQLKPGADASVDPVRTPPPTRTGAPARPRVDPGRASWTRRVVLALAVTVAGGLAAPPWRARGAGLPPRPGDGRELPLHTAPLFVDGMLLPSGRPVPVWGWGQPGRTVVVHIGSQRRQATIAADGTWQVELPALKPATGLAMTVADGSDTVEHDRITVTAAEPLLAAVRARLVDPKATPETVALFHNLKCYSRRHTLVGQQDPEVSCTGEAGETDIKRTTGSDPAVWGSDFMHITHPSNDGGKNWFHDQEVKIVRLAAAAYDSGMVNIFCWHFREPYEEKAFDAKEMTAESRRQAFRSLLPGGAKHDWYKGKLATIAAVVTSIKGRDGTLAPIIFRPFHELDGDWFWWGKKYCSAEEYRECWRFTVRHLRDDLGVHNLLYAFSPDCRFGTEREYLERYPGDEFVDVVGFDDYADFEANRAAAAAQKLAVVSTYARRHLKVAALTEVGYRKRPVPPTLFTTAYGAALADPALEIAFMMFWRQGKLADKGGYFVPVPGCDSVADFLEFAAGPRPLFLSGVRHLYSITALQPLER